MRRLSIPARTSVFDTPESAEIGHCLDGAEVAPGSVTSHCPNTAGTGAVAMEHRTLGPFEASGLPYSDAYEVVPVKDRQSSAQPYVKLHGDDVPAPLPSIVELDSTLLIDAPTLPPPIHFNPGEAVLAPASVAHVLTVPPSPQYRPPPVRKPRASKRVVAAFAAVATSCVALAALGATWVQSRVASEHATPAISVEPDSLTDTTFAVAIPRITHATATRANREAVATHVERAARVARPMPSEPVIHLRTPALPPNPGATSRATRSIVYASAGQSCGQRCNGNIDCLLTCRPAGSDARANALVLPEPTAVQVSMAMQTVRGAVLMCVLSLGSNAPAEARVMVTFNSSGRVTGSTLNAPLRNTYAGNCVERAVQRAHVPPFEHPSFQTQTSFSTE